MNKILRMTLMGLAAMVSSLSFADQTVTFTAGTDKGSNSAATSADQVSKDGITIDVTQGAFATAQYRFAKSSTATFTSTVGKITKIVFTCTANGTVKYGPGCFTLPTDGSGVGEYAYDGKTGTWTGEAETVWLAASSNQVRATSIEVTYVPTGETPAETVAAPEITGESPFTDKTTVTITVPDSTTVYYTTDGTTPSDQGDDYTGPFEITTTTTVKAVAYKGDAKSDVVTEKFLKQVTTTGQGTVDNPYTVTDIIALNAEDQLPTDTAVVAGTVSKVGDYNSSYGQVTYWLANPNTTDTLEVYGGLYLAGEKFTSADQIKEGDEATVKGKLTVFHGTLEFNYRSQILKLVRDGKEVTGEDTPEPTPTPTDKGTEANPYTVAEVLALATLPSDTVYIAGKVVATVTGTTYGNANYYISDDGTTTGQLQIYRGRYIDGADFTAAQLLEAGDEVVVKGKLATFRSTTQVGAGSSIVTINGSKQGKTAGELQPTDKGGTENPYTVAEVNALATLPAVEVCVKGQVVADVTGDDTYHNATYYISDDGTETGQLEVYHGKYLDGADFTSAESLKAGDEVVVKGKLQDYNGTRELTSNSSIVSINGQTTAISAIKGGAADDAPAYNLAGQRVGASYKGVVVKNGRKFVRK